MEHDRPDLAPGRTPEDAVLGDPERWVDPSAFGLIGRKWMRLFKEYCDLRPEESVNLSLGATLNPQTLDRLTVKAVVGAANNQLADDSEKVRVNPDGTGLRVLGRFGFGGGSWAVAICHRYRNPGLYRQPQGQKEMAGSVRCIRE